MVVRNRSRALEVEMSKVPGTRLAINSGPDRRASARCTANMPSASAIALTGSIIPGLRGLNLWGVNLAPRRHSPLERAVKDRGNEGIQLGGGFGLARCH